MRLAPATSRAEALASRLEHRIAEEGLGAGQRIGTKDELRLDAGVAIGTLNQALRLLEARGSVVMKSGPRGGVYVAGAHPLVRLGRTLMSVRGQAVAVKDAVSVRDALEPMLCTEAARLRTDDDIHDLRRLIDKMSAAVTDPAAFLRANWALHRRIAKIVQNRVLASFYDALSDFIEANFEEVVNPTDELGYKQSRLQIHIDLVEAIAAGNKASVARAIRRHTLENAPKRTTNSRAVKSTKARNRDLPDA